ncbi:MAG: acyl-CoA thioesterase [Clostridia bacterium]|nr:acyl-CoA thioesterase [Clostridia bacterium]MBQ6374868.1 acyl-CoA thioesterase [Clostridia bacterium]
MKPYVRSVQYYETDMMGVVHHANYLHWMEEARIDFMDQLGFPYARMEAEGVLSPVRSLACDYRHACTFGDEITIALSVASFNGVIMAIEYTMKDQRGETVCTARSEHVFLNREGRFVRMKRDMPAFCEAIEGVMGGNGEK